MVQFIVDLKSMALQNIKLKLVLRVLLLGASLFLVAHLLFEKVQYVRAAFAAIIPIATTIELIYFLDRNNRRINDFFESLLWDDHSIVLPQNLKTKSYNTLNTTINKLNHKLLDLRKVNFAQLFFIESLIKEALVGLLVVDSRQEVYFVNKSFERLTGCKINRLKPIENELGNMWPQINEMSIGEKRTLPVSINGEKSILLFQTSEFIIEHEKYRLFSSQNIHAEVENTEIETWKKLIRVLSHEILNSTTPILSLSHTLNDIAQDSEIEPKAKIDKLNFGLKTIIERSTGLIKFTDAFQRISKVPDPQKVCINTLELFQKIASLFESQLTENNITLSTEVHPNASSVFADKYQIEQVLINLIKNATEAIQGKSSGTITLKAYLALSENFCIEVTDNGHGIPSDKMNQVFTPFFTTKPEGNGIGLAFSKQVMKNHKGDISIFSEQGKGTKALLILPSPK